MLRLSCSIKNYHWGKKGSDSYVGKLAHRSCIPFTLDNDQFYAEVCK